MAILKPVNITPNNIAVDATNDITISWKNMGDRQYYYQVLVYDLENVLVYDSTKINGLNSFHIVGKNILSNGMQLKFVITVWNQIEDFSMSDWVVFKTSSIPTCQFTNIADGQEILNSTYLLQGQYFQAEDVPIKSWNMILYDTNDYIIGSSDIQYSDVIEYQFEGLNNDSDYKVELQVRSQDDLINTTGKIQFHVRYEVPTGSIALEASNVKEKAAVRLQWKVIQIIGKITQGTIQFIDGEKIDLTNGTIAFQEGMPNFREFSLKLWIDWTDLKNDIITHQVNTSIGIINWNVRECSTEILRIKTPLGDIWVEWIYENDVSGRFNVYKDFYDTIYHITSPLLSPIINDNIYLGVDFNGNLADIYTEILL